MNEDQARMWVDRALYGASFARPRGDGSYERVDPRDVRREMDERDRAIRAVAEELGVEEFVLRSGQATPRPAADPMRPRGML